MKEALLQQALETMASMPGVDGCALVEIDAGMVWGHAGAIDEVHTFAEAATDYWRLYHRLAPQFDTLGSLRASVMIHKKGRLTLLPCGKGMMLLALTGHHSSTDWSQWQKLTRELAVLMENR
ncbi:hypothetical protein [Ottowia thiooxydans]|uniref:hypothetical protein n=1 Tax=Ottowia thiooxydans TaxID=219182 RepID=UPI0004027FE2|nr:hypothetical protein [Ottowia thiooxydans]